MFLENYRDNSIELNRFSIEILNYNARKERINGHTYISLPHRSEYKIKLSNGRDTKCDAQVYIDGEKIGTWRIGSSPR